jgi:hypothetical protein
MLSSKRRASGGGGACVPSYFFSSPAAASLATDTIFLATLIWVLIDAANVMQSQYTWWWALPAAFAAPAMLVLLLKIRYVRRMCDIHWQEDNDWNARIILVPLIGALANTFMASAWLVCSPFYVTELVRASSVTTNAAASSVDEFRIQTLQLLAQPSSIMFLLAYVASTVCAVLVSVR